MAVTLTTNYKETLKPETVADIEEKCVEGSYSLEDALIFIDERGEEEFLSYYETYVDRGEEYSYGAVDAFLKVRDIDELDRFSDYYMGEYSSPAAFAEDILDYEVSCLSSVIVVDWEATADYILTHDYDQVGDFYFRYF